MTVRLRPHHLLCSLTYIGKGYNAAFIAHYNAVAARLRAGEEIEIVSGPDDICAPLLCEKEPHCCGKAAAEYDRAAAAEVGELLGIAVKAGGKIADIRRLLPLMRAAFADVSRRQCCGGCQWSALCGAVAKAGYKDVLLR